MILSKKKEYRTFFHVPVLATILTVDSMTCQELDRYLKENRHDLIIVNIEREITRFELMDFE